MKIKRQELFTVPNLLTFLRLLMIPLIAHMYRQGNMSGTAILLVVSGVTDVADGYIARRFHQVSDFGKAFDPVADKMTQAVLLLCLTQHHPATKLPLALLVIKELFALVSGAVVIRKTGVVNGAQWHGKVATLLLYAMMILHVLWKDIPVWVSNTFNIGCVAMMLLSLVLYARRNWQAIRSAAKE